MNSVHADSGRTDTEQMEIDERIRRYSEQADRGEIEFIPCQTRLTDVPFGWGSVDIPSSVPEYKRPMSQEWQEQVYSDYIDHVNKLSSDSFYRGEHMAKIEASNQTMLELFEMGEFENLD